jgi:hypothetical protein
MEDLWIERLDGRQGNSVVFNASRTARRLAGLTGEIHAWRSSPEMLVLVAIDSGAVLYASISGTTRLLRTIDYRSCIDDKGLVANGISLAYKLLIMLERESVEYARCGSVAIFAEGALHEEFCRLRAITRRSFFVARLESPEQITAAVFQ